MTPIEFDAAARGLARRLARRILKIQDALPGIADRHSLNALALEIAWSQTRIRELRSSANSGRPNDAGSPSTRDWDPHSAIVSLHYKGDIEEATWLAFLSIHIGNRQDYGWLALRTVYAGLGDGLLDWGRVRDDPAFLTGWCVRHAEELRRLRFGNHRKFESWKQFNDVVTSYVVGVVQRTGGSQELLFEAGALSPQVNFDRLMRRLGFIYRFGRLAIYDLLAVLGDLGVYGLDPGRVYLASATGPLAGARRLFGDAREDPNVLDKRTVDLAQALDVSISAMEDGLCNWQKRF